MSILHDASDNGQATTKFDLWSLVVLVGKKWFRRLAPSVLLGLPLALYIFVPVGVAYELVRPSTDGLPPFELAPLCLLAGVRAVHLLRRHSFLRPCLLGLLVAAGLVLGETFLELPGGQSATTAETLLFGLSALSPLLFLVVDGIMSSARWRSPETTTQPAH